MLIRQQIEEILTTVRVASMATVNEDGSPHNSPLVFLYDQNMKHVFWASDPISQHAQNVLRTRQAYFTVFDSRVGRVGLYLKTSGGKIVTGSELEQALEIHNHFRAKLGKPAIALEYYQGESPQRMWQSTVQQVWINAYQRTADGQLLRDYKIEINTSELVGLW